MRFKSKDPRRLRRWFAWYPVLTYDTDEWVWLEFLYRKTKWEPVFKIYVNFYYSEKPDEVIKPGVIDDKKNRCTD